MTEKEVHIWDRIEMLKKKAAKRYDIDEEKCHLGHVLLEGLLDNPNEISQFQRNWQKRHANIILDAGSMHRVCDAIIEEKKKTNKKVIDEQIDAATDEKETFKSVATRTAQLASAMRNFGLKVGDCVVITGFNDLNLVVPFYACNYNGYPLCAVDPGADPRDLIYLFNCIQPKMVFCPKAKEEHIKQAFKKNLLPENIVYLDDKENNLESFIKTYGGTKINFRPAEFDPSKVTAWYMLTSGTTGLPKVAIIPFDTLLFSVGCWWEKFTADFKITMAMATIQWLSSLFFFVSGPLRNYTRVQSSIPLTPVRLVGLINKYKPNVTAWTPHLLNQFLKASENVCDLSSFKYIAIGGSAIEKPLLDKFQERCNAYLYLVYGMTELLIPVFDFVDETPFGSTGLPFKKLQYKIVSDEGKNLDKPFETGELWIKGDGFFKGYLNNPEETQSILTDDGWVKTGDIFYKDEKDFYYFVERKRLLIKYTGLWVSPLQLEEVIRRHPSVLDVCVVGIPDPDVVEMPVAAIVNKNGNKIEPKEIFDLIKDAVPEIRRLHGGFFYIDSLPETPSGKVHRAKIKDIAMVTPRITPES